jgi:hypothetical protein
MVNRKKRDLASGLIRQFLACEITNDEFVDRYPNPDRDRAIEAIIDALWGFWDDLHTHTLTARYGLNPQARALFERCVVFLNSDLEYEWPPLVLRSLSQSFLRLIGLRNIADRRSEEWTQKTNSIGPWEVWPFFRKEDCVKFTQRL